MHGATFTEPAVREEHYVRFSGRVAEVLPAGFFRVELVDRGTTVLAYLAGRLRKSRIRIVLGDAVTVAVSVYDPRRGRIVYRS